MRTGTRTTVARGGTRHARRELPAPSKHKILSSAEIPLELIEENPYNPRPSFHFTADDPGIAKIADSLAVTGQQNPAKVYEIPDKPGHYRLVQGHRRFHSARLRNLINLSCIIISAPTSLAEELDDLGSDDSYKEAWGPFSAMNYARMLVEANELETFDCIDVQARTGLSSAQLRTAEKMFHLSPTIVAHVKMWEECQYVAKNSEGRPAARSYIPESQIAVEGFSPEKAALVWELFCALHEHAQAALVGQGWTDDQTLQIRLAQLASRGKRNDLVSWRLAIESMDKNPGALAQIIDILEDKSHSRSVRNLVHSTQNADVNKLAKMAQQADRLTTTMRALNTAADQFGSDTELLADVSHMLGRIVLAAERLQTSVDNRLRKLNRG